MLKVNVIANFVGVFYSAFIALIILPMCMKYVGPEEFGLVGFFFLVQSVMQVVDFGVSPVIMRLAAEAQSKTRSAFELKEVVRSYELILAITVCVFLMAAFFYGDDFISVWFYGEEIEPKTLKNCFDLVVLAVVAIVFSSIYRSGLIGLERQVVVNIVNVVFLSLRYFSALASLAFSGGDVVIFFLVNFVFLCIELMCLIFVFYSCAPGDYRAAFKFHKASFKKYYRLGLHVFYVNMIWLIFIQFDRALMSKILTLKEFGYLAVVATLAAGVMQITKPISQAVLPKMTLAFVENDFNRMVYLYRSATEFTAVIAFSVAGFVAFYSQEVMYIWTGSLDASSWGKGVLFCYSVGYAFLSVSAFLYHLQFASGDIRMHIAWNTALMLIQVPATYFVATKYGINETAFLWMLFCLVNFLVWSPFVHRVFLSGVHKNWLRNDIAPVLLISFLYFFMSYNVYAGFSFFSAAGTGVLFLFGFVGFLVGCLASGFTRKAIFDYVKVFINEVKKRK